MLRLLRFVPRYHAFSGGFMQLELDAPTNDVIAMNLTIAALDRWLSTISSEQSGEEVGREIGAMYRAIHEVVDEVSPEDDEDEEEDDEDEAEDELTVSGFVRE
jgi:hypothetical protein